MKIKHYILTILLCLVAGTGFAQEEKWGMNNPYMDDGLFHWGFQIGVQACSFSPTNKLEAIVQSPGVGIHIGFIGDLRLHKYFNLRCTPAIEFNYRPVNNKTNPTNELTTAIPLVLPIYLKFSAERAANFRPYIITGGGVIYNIMPYNYEPSAGKDYALQPFDAFVEAGFGCDLYFRWFKLCPELTYRIGFIDQAEKGFGNDKFINQAICLTFNFQD